MVVLCIIAIIIFAFGWFGGMYYEKSCSKEDTTSADNFVPDTKSDTTQPQPKPEPKLEYVQEVFDTNTGCSSKEKQKPTPAKKKVTKKPNTIKRPVETKKTSTKPIPTKTKRK